MGNFPEAGEGFATCKLGSNCAVYPHTLLHMKRNFHIPVVLAVGILSGLTPAFGGTVITANLPPNTAIVNVSGTQDGSASFNGDQSLWYQPFNTGGQLLEYTVAAGTYGFRVINPTDAAQRYPALTGTQTNQIFSAWTYNSPWITDYLVFDSSATNHSGLPQLFDGAFATSGPPNYGNAADAYQGAVTHGFANVMRTSDTGGRDSTNVITTYTFTTNSTLIFVVPDYDLNDNGGGVSVLITPAFPVRLRTFLPPMRARSP